MNITIGTDSFDIYPLQSVNISRAAIYTIWTFNPVINRYPLLYVGETGDLGQRIDANHHKYQSWIDNAINNALFIGIKLMPTTLYTEQQRRTEEMRLINAHNPICNS